MFLIEKIMKMLKIKENVITVIIENDKINITVKNNTKLLRTMIGRLFA